MVPVDQALQAIASFSLAAGMLTITPGLDTALILRTAAVKNGRQAFLIALGTSTGCFLWCVLAAVGLGALLLLSAQLYDTIRLFGAVYLIYLGATMIWRSKKGNLPTATNISITGDIDASKTQEQKPFQSFCQGLLNNLLNPKVGLFYATFLPQFIPKDLPVELFSILLGSIHALEGILWGAVLILATRPLSHWLKKPTFTQNLDRATGAILLFFGIKLVTEHQTT